MGAPRLYSAFAPSPDGRFLIVALAGAPLLLHRALRPLPQAHPDLGPVRASAAGPARGSTFEGMHTITTWNWSQG